MAFYVLLAAWPAGSLLAQGDDFGLWLSAGVKKRVLPGLDATVEGEFRTRDGLGSVDRWSLAAGAAYRVCPYLKVDAGYTFIDSNREGGTTGSGNNYYNDYWSARHRVTASLTGRYVWHRVEFSLRERYQYTHRAATSVHKYNASSGAQKKNDKLVAAKSTSVLRSRLQVQWDIRKSPFSPYASCELYHNLTGGWSLAKTRWTVGTEYKINKRHGLDVFYRYQNRADDDEQDGHVVGAGYQFKF